MRFRIGVSLFASAFLFALAGVALASSVMMARVELPTRAFEQKLVSIITALDVVEVNRGEWVRIVTDAEEVDRLRGMGFSVVVEHEDLEAYYRSRLASDKPMGGFSTFSETIDFLDSLHAAHPDITTERDSVGATVEGNALWAMKISDNPDIDEDEPEVLYDGLHHAREPITVDLLLYFMSYLVDNYGTIPGVTELVNERELWFIPIVNPDGYLYNQQIEPGGGGMWRKNRSYNSGYYGVDLNRNYGYMWGYDNEGSSPYPWDETYRGPSPFSELETQAMRDFTAAHSFVLAMNYHSHGNLFLYPWGYEDIYTPDHQLLTTVADTVVAYTGYAPGTAWELLYNTNGDANDWMYGDATKPKVFAFTTEVGNSSDGFWPPTYRIPQLCEENLDPNLFIARIADNPWKLLPPEQPVLSCPDTVSGSSLELTWRHDDSLNPAVSYQVIQKQDYTRSSDDLEAGTANWQLDGFFWSISRWHSSNHSFYSGEDNRLNVSVTTGEWLLIASPDTLTFWCWYDIEDDWDYAYVEASSDGSVFASLPGNITTNYDPNGNNKGNGITGSSGGWTVATFPLDDYVGQQIVVRVHYVTDAYVTDEGFYFDDFYPVDAFGQVDTLAEAISDTALSVADLEDSATYYFQVRAQDAQSQWSPWSNTETVFTTSVGVHTDDPTMRPLRFELSQNYPNPFNPITEIAYTLPRECWVTLDVYNVLGHKVATLVNEHQKAGHKRVQWDIESQAAQGSGSGVYFYRISAGDFVETRKMVLLR